MVCINGVRGNRREKLVALIFAKQKYIGVTVKGSQNSSFQSMWDRIKEANGVLGMVKFAESRIGSKYVIGRDGWKGLVVNKLIYDCGVFVWSQNEYNDLEVKHNEMWRWFWDVVNVKNELIRGETDWAHLKNEKRRRW